MHAEETILLAEDDPIVRDVTKTILEYGGYRVVTAENGQEAVLQYSSNSIALLLMDVVMPVMNGVEAYRIIKASNPDVRILFTSGFTSDILVREGIDAKDKRLLQKPVSPDILLKAVRAALDSPL